MKKWMIVAVMMFGTEVCLAQDSGGEFQGFYQRVQSFNFNSGDPIFNVQNGNTNGGGFGFVYNITPVFSLFQQTSFFGGFEQSGLKMRLITEAQGVRLSKGTDAILFYAKGGVGFNRYVLENLGIDYGTAFILGGGAEIRMTEGLYLLLEATNLTMGLPNLTNLPGRSKWDNALLFTTGIAIRF